MSVERIRGTVPNGITLDEAKDWSKAEGDWEDAVFAALIDAVTIEAEEYAQIALHSQTVRITLPGWPKGHVRLPIAPILDRASIRVTIDGEPWADVSIEGGARPLLILCGHPPAGAVVVEYRAGFGDSQSDIPADIRQAMMDQILIYKESRGAADPGLRTFSPHFARVLGRYRGVGI